MKKTLTREMDFSKLYKLLKTRQKAFKEVARKTKKVLDKVRETW